MRPDATLSRRLRGLGLLLGLAFASAAPAQLPAGPPPPPDPLEAAAAPEGRSARPARARSSLRPYLEIDQVVSAQLDGNSDVLTYTALAAGVDGRLVTRRVTAQMSYRYERRIGWNGDLADQDVHTGIGMVGAEIVPGLLNVEAGALATRTAGEGGAVGLTDRDASVNVYSVYAGPTVSARAGPVSVNGSYRLGYVAIDDDTLAGGAPREDFDEAVAHSAAASVGMAPGRLPVGWTVGAAYNREDSGALDHRFESAAVRADLVVPVTPTLALTAGVGYETLQASQQDIAVGSDGAPIVGPDGRLVGDPSRPRLLTLDIDGLIYDAGIIWRPTSRTELQARAGHRYGGTTIVATLQHRFNRSYGLSVSVFDGVQTFGNLLINDLSALPDEFEIPTDPLSGDLGLGGCVFGTEPGSGVCLDRALQSIGGASFRHRGVSLLFSGSRGPWDFGAGASFSHRRYFAPEGTLFATLQPRVDRSVSVYGTLARQLSRESSIDFNAYASWFDSERAGFDRSFNAGLTAGYRRSFLLDRLQLLVALGLFHADGSAIDGTSASALLGLRYTF